MARAEIDGTPEVAKFAETLEDVIIKTVEAGHMTKDLALLVGSDQGYQTTDEFMASIAENLKARLI
jgi:isocitrate dehydrogenase